MALSVVSRRYVNWNGTVLGVLAAVLVVLAPLRASAQTTTQVLSAVVAPAGGLFTISASAALTKSGTVFSTYTTSAPVIVQYRARTTQGAGSAAITVKASTDFACASAGPCIATPPTAGDALTYVCSGATQGANCSGVQTVSTTSSSPVVSIPAASCTGGGGTCSSVDPNTVSVMLSLTDDPKYRTGTYTAVLTFTISAS